VNLFGTDDIDRIIHGRSDADGTLRSHYARLLMEEKPIASVNAGLVGAASATAAARRFAGKDVPRVLDAIEAAGLKLVAASEPASERCVYLASRYSRFEEMQGYAADLKGAGYGVTSRWIYGDHQITDEGLSAEAKQAERTRFAQEDWSDLMRAAICISFTEPPRATNSRGGRHVEFGAALAAGKRCIVVGNRENVFHCLPGVEFFGSWAEAMTALFLAGVQSK
jgi:hypothetical protein